MQYVTYELCDSKHTANSDKIDHIDKAVEKIEGRQWLVLVTVAGTAVLTLINIILGVR